MELKKKQAEPFSIEEEDELWKKGFLGNSSPQVLLDTMVFLCGMCFALRSGQEHRNLQFSQIELVEPQDSDSTPYLVYYENISKNNTGGIAQRKRDPKLVKHHANNTNPSRCFVRLYKEYINHCPEDRKCSAFYLTPLKKPKGSLWYGVTPVGHNTLAKTVSRLCQVSGMSGYKTNHSLRVTTATWLFQAGVEEQLIMSRTGHQSLDGVRTYKRVSEEQCQQVSSVLNSATNCAPHQNKKIKRHDHQEQAPLTLSNCTNITINFNK